MRSGHLLLFAAAALCVVVHHAAAQCAPGGEWRANLCVQCAPGYYNPTGEGECVPCAYGRVWGADRCEDDAGDSETTSSVISTTAADADALALQQAMVRDSRGQDDVVPATHQNHWTP